MPLSASGVHNFKLHEIRVPISQLPLSFEGIRIVHISDIHAGSFFDKRSVKKGVTEVMRQRPDMIFFTGDLVNRSTRELEDHFGALSKLKAPLGVYSILGNHDYGDYVDWPTANMKRQNLLEMVEAHRALGWDLLLNQHRILQLGSASMAILGVENWGIGRFSKYGRLDEAYRGAEEADVKILLTHDPSHWEARVLPDHSDIDVTFAGHTHGFQFGLELGTLQWSPFRVLYKQWAGLYEHDGQYLYVNRGFGYMMNIPFRVGIRPEITVVELIRKE